MINKKDISWTCCVCPMSTTTLHEVFYGTANRQIAIDHNIQVPVCDGDPDSHHMKAHARAKHNEKSPEMWARTFCDWLDISYIRCLQSFNGLDNKNYLYEIMDKCKEKVDSVAEF